MGLQIRALEDTTGSPIPGNSCCCARCSSPVGRVYQKKCPNCNLCVLELRTGPVVVVGVGTGIFFDVDPRGGVGPSGSPGGGYPISEGFFLFSVRSAEKVWTPERMKISPGPPPSPGGYPCVGGDHLPLALKKSLLRIPALHQTAGTTELSQEADSLTTLRGIFWMAPASEDLGQRGARRGSEFHGRGACGSFFEFQNSEFGVAVVGGRVVWSPCV